MKRHQQNGTLFYFSEQANRCAGACVCVVDIVALFWNVSVIYYHCFIYTHTHVIHSLSLSTTFFVCLFVISLHANKDMGSRHWWRQTDRQMWQGVVRLLQFSKVTFGLMSKVPPFCLTHKHFTCHFCSTCCFSHVGWIKPLEVCTTKGSGGEGGDIMAHQREESGTMFFHPLLIPFHIYWQQWCVLCQHTTLKQWSHDVPCGAIVFFLRLRWKSTVLTAPQIKCGS